jgi:hypothetical protein
VKLFEFAYGCRLYGQLAGYDASLRRFRDRVAPSLDPSRAAHRAALFVWLNSWGCRQFALEHHATTASDSLVRWAGVWLSRLPPPDVLLTDLTPVEIRACAAAYEALRHETASFKSRGGRSHAVTYGPTGAAKTLFALRPNVVPPWDDPIRGALGLGGDLESFGDYLLGVAEQLGALALEADVPVSELPAFVGRPDSSPPKLIDEYNWAVITKGCVPPTADEVITWAGWALTGKMPHEAQTRLREREAIPADELTTCPDCGIDAWGFEEDGRIVHEDFYVSNELWDATCPDDDTVRWTQDGSELAQGRFVICIGCFEKRLGRQLTLRDFGGEPGDEGPGDLIGTPPSRRYLDRWAAVP